LIIEDEIIFGFGYMNCGTQETRLHKH